MEIANQILLESIKKMNRLCDYLNETFLEFSNGEIIVLFLAIVSKFRCVDNPLSIRKFRAII